MAGDIRQDEGKLEKKKKGNRIFYQKNYPALAYVQKKQYLCREICSFAALASKNVLKNI